jgi:hypothetical protein
LAILHIGKALRKAGISKSFGLSSLAVFQIIFSLVFKGKNWFRLLESERGVGLLGKDVVYRFLNQATFAWRHFLQTLSLRIVSLSNRIFHLRVYKYSSSTIPF